MSDRGKQVELSVIHDFAGKLLQPGVLGRLKEYVRGRAAGEGGLPDCGLPDWAPVSINLDLTTSCNFACDHCVDMAILNTGIKYETNVLLDSLSLMARKGLKSVIVIGGGEPTVHPHFTRVIRHMKDRGLQVSVVSNGSGNRKLAEIADRLEIGDWIRLSLDSGTDETFQAMHKPKKQVTLEEICAGVPSIRAGGESFKIGFSFVITWRGASIHDLDIVENVHEMAAAAALAKRSGFDYIAFKPFLTRAVSNNAEIVDLSDTDAIFEDVIARIRAQVVEAKKLENDSFRVYETTNLKVLENRSYRDFTEQPHHCHMQFFRQVLSPLGMYNCPVYRNQPHGRIGSKEAFANSEEYERTLASTGELIRTFDAREQCREVTCLYNHANWWIEDLIAHPEKLDGLEERTLEEPDYFL